ncbi:hypothetical protein [Streptomyces sp. NPDC060035]|uniref:hypothetical protein n=1 Tax=Streptomyces sp. NPDC060035 TaxID=3347044 RepID=UPI00368C3BDA
MAETYGFPDDLRAAQLDLHRTRAEYAARCQAMPWSAIPEPGRTSEKHVPGDRGVSLPDSPGCTAGQAAEVQRLRRRLIDLSVTVSTHPYWATSTTDVVDARMALGPAHEQAEDKAA